MRPGSPAISSKSAAACPSPSPSPSPEGRFLAATNHTQKQGKANSARSSFLRTRCPGRSRSRPLPAGAQLPSPRGARPGQAPPGLSAPRLRVLPAAPAAACGKPPRNQAAPQALGAGGHGAEGARGGGDAAHRVAAPSRGRIALVPRPGHVRQGRLLRGGIGRPWTSSRGLRSCRRLSGDTHTPRAGCGAAARQPPGRPRSSVRAPRPPRSRPRAAPRTPPPARAGAQESRDFRRLRPRAAGRRAGPQNFPK